MHLVTAFLYAGLASRPYWNNALMGPRFLATAFAAGPALMILILDVIRRKTDFDVGESTIRKLSLVVTVAAQISLIMLLSEVFKEFYFPIHHSLSAQYLYFGLDGKASLKPDLAHFYDSVHTTTSTNNTAYTTSFGGTSAATPITAGHFGLFFQMWQIGRAHV